MIFIVTDFENKVMTIGGFFLFWTTFIVFIESKIKTVILLMIDPRPAWSNTTVSEQHRETALVVVMSDSISPQLV